MLELLSLLAFFAVILYLYLGLIVIIRDRQSPAHRFFFLICIELAIWAAGFMIGNYTPDIRVQWLTYRISSFAWCLTPALTLHWFCILTKGDRFARIWWLYPVLYIPGILFIWQAWFDILAVTDFIRVPAGWVGVPASGHIWSNLYLWHTIICYLTGIILALSRWLRSSIRHERMQALIIGSSMFISLVLSTVFDLLFAPSVPVNASIFIMIWAFATWYSITKHRFLATTPAIVFDEVISNIRDLLIFVDVTGIIIRINHEMAVLIGKKETDIVGYPLTDFIKDHRYDGAEGDTRTENSAHHLLRDFAGTGLLGHNRKHLLCITADSREIPLSGYIGLIRDKTGEPAGSILVAQDMRPSLQLIQEITERKKTEKALALARDDLERKVLERTAELEEKNRQLLMEIDERQKVEEQFRQAQKMDALGQLAGGVAHDLNNLLTPIMGYADFIAHSSRATAAQPAPSSGNPKVEKWAASIKASAGRAADLVKKLLTVSRKATSKSSDVDVHAIITDVTTLLGQIVDRGITITKTFKAPQHTIHADQSQVHSALLNLAINARDAMPEGGTLTFSTAVCTEGDIPENTLLKPNPSQAYLLISVRDTGTGIPQESLRQIFDPFYTTKEQGKGTGLGLTSVYRTVANFGGTIHVWSQTGTGSVFSIWFPLVSLKTENQPLASSDELPCGEGLVLVIDDESEICELARCILQHGGYTVQTYSSAPDALLYLNANAAQVRAVVTDINMPLMNGYELLQRIKKENHMIPVAIMTGNVTNEDPVSPSAVMPDAAISKPFTTAALLKVLHTLLNRSNDGKTGPADLEQK